MGAGAVAYASSHGAEVTLGSPCSQGKVSQPAQALRWGTWARDSPVLTGPFANATSELSPLCTLGLALCCPVGVRKRCFGSYPAGRIFSLGFPPPSHALSVARSPVPSGCLQHQEHTLLLWRKASQSC